MQRETPGKGAGRRGTYRPHCSARDPLSEILDAMARDGIAPADGALVADGRLHRYRVEGDKPGTRNGWYVIHLDGVPAAAYGSWRAGVSSTWRARDPATEAERQEQRERMEAARRQRDAEQARQHERAAARAANLWRKARPADPKHPYLAAKGIPPLKARQLGARLVLPLYTFDRRLASLQFIDGDGGKKLLSGGRKRGAFIPVAGRADAAHRLLIAEGWATGASLHRLDPEALVLASVDAHNLQAVATGARAQWPDMPIVVCSDDDAVGEQKARAAGLAVGGRVAMPLQDNTKGDV